LSPAPPRGSAAPPRSFAAEGALVYAADIHHLDRRNLRVAIAATRSRADHAVSGPDGPSDVSLRRASVPASAAMEKRLVMPGMTASLPRRQEPTTKNSDGQRAAIAKELWATARGGAISSAHETGSRRTRHRNQRRGLVEVTDAVVRWVREQGMTTGLLTMLCRHTSASLCIQENAAREVRGDVALDRMAPESGTYAHDDEGAR
jgi:hypothetical protein